MVSKCLRLKSSFSLILLGQPIGLREAEPHLGVRVLDGVRTWEKN